MATPRPKRAPICLEVLRTQAITPNLRRVVLGGDGFDGYTQNEFTDRYVKLVLPRPGTALPEPLDLESIRSTRPQAEWPVVRTYTVRSYDKAARELVIDFVLHGESGVAGPWAATAQPGDRLHAMGPGGAYAPRSDADWHLLVGDDSAMPAISAALDLIADSRPVYLIIELAHPEERAYLDLPARAVVRWLESDGSASALSDAVRTLEFPSGAVQVFAHGELGSIRELRRHLLDERGMALEWVSISGYWRRGKDEDGFQAEKAEEARAAPAG